ncbi:hypothetical protein BKA70DRAFT_1271636 [Coprinopsis sp. MPI-PUGE-AT-0042]|nr:hypothetical protein BKA70DRAFT_1271636 [Coprinopsis sp. MPI-PUGE-AT-0042]
MHTTSLPSRVWRTLCVTLFPGRLLHAVPTYHTLLRGAGVEDEGRCGLTQESERSATGRTGANSDRTMRAARYRQRLSVLHG